MSVVHWIILLIIAFPLFFLPTIIAFQKDHPYKIAIMILNIVGSAIAGLGWLAAMIWCFVLPRSELGISSSVATELEKLHQLKEKGALTQEEFDTRKKSLLAT